MRLGGSDGELGTQPRSFLSVPQPGFTWFDHGGESAFLQCGRYICAVAHDHLARDSQPEAPRPREGPLLADRDRPRRLRAALHADPWPGARPGATRRAPGRRIASWPSCRARTAPGSAAAPPLHSPLVSWLVSHGGCCPKVQIRPRRTAAARSRARRDDYSAGRATFPARCKSHVHGRPGWSGCLAVVRRARSSTKYAATWESPSSRLVFSPSPDRKSVV